MVAEATPESEAAEIFRIEDVVLPKRKRFKLFGVEHEILNTEELGLFDATWAYMKYDRATEILATSRVKKLSISQKKEYSDIQVELLKTIVPTVTDEDIARLSHRETEILAVILIFFGEALMSLTAINPPNRKTQRSIGERRSRTSKDSTMPVTP